MSEGFECYRASDGTRLAVGCYCAREPGAVVLLIHGIASHMGWYGSIAEELQRRGVSTYLFDRRGVARSEGTRAHAATWGVLVSDVVDLAEAIERAHPGQPLHAMGISLGGAIALACAIDRPHLFRTLVLLSPALASSVRIPIGRKLATVGRALVAPTSLMDLPFGVGQLTSNASWRDVLENDPHRTRRVSARFLLEVIRLQRSIRRRIRHVSEPVLAFFGEMDEIIDNERSIEVLRGISEATVRIEVFEAVAHVLAASIPRRELADRIVQWLGGDHGPARQDLASERFSLLKTVVDQQVGEFDAPPRLDQEAMA